MNHEPSTSRLRGPFIRRGPHWPVPAGRGRKGKAGVPRKFQSPTDTKALRRQELSRSPRRASCGSWRPAAARLPEPRSSESRRQREGGICGHPCSMRSHCANTTTSELPQTPWSFAGTPGYPCPARAGSRQALAARTAGDASLIQTAERQAHPFGPSPGI